MPSCSAPGCSNRSDKVPEKRLSFEFIICRLKTKIWQKSGWTSFVGMHVLWQNKNNLIEVKAARLEFNYTFWCQVKKKTTQLNKLTSVFYASVLLLMINFVITLSKCCQFVFTITKNQNCFSNEGKKCKSQWTMRLPHRSEFDRCIRFGESQPRKLKVTLVRIGQKYKEKFKLLN